LSPDPKGRVVALGNFDGVHLGHQAVITQAGLLASAMGAVFCVMTFEPHPRRVFQPDLPPFRLTPFRVKTRLIEEMGADLCLMQHFDREFASQTAEAFVTDLLVGHLGVKGVVVGHDYVFGKDRQGNPDFLRDKGRDYGFQVVEVAAVAAPDGEVYSSTAVRTHLTSGRPAEAAKLLGRVWEVDGRVEHGDARGRTIGFPTANLSIADYLRPASGVYAVRAALEDGGPVQWLPGVANFGRRPTFGKTEDLLEVHLLDFSGDLYGRHMRVQLVDFIRPERKFAGIDELKAQIVVDAECARGKLEGVL
jgi:riboflavin kinase/FMN adenylyltransferase